MGKKSSSKKKSKKKSRKKSRGKQQRLTTKVIKFLLLSAILCTLLFSLFFMAVYYGAWGRIPDYQMLKNIRNYEASTLYSSDGVVLGKYYIENRTNVPFDAISNNAVNALIATEDVRFFEHHGIDKISFLRVVIKTVILGDKSSGGGSTISQQLAKNLFPRESNSLIYMPINKTKEIITAHRLESLYSKADIITLYLNTVSFGEEAFGIESAAQKYFSVSATQLSIPQAATLIGMLKGPSYYNPRLHPERAIERRDVVIKQMEKYDYLTKEESERLQKNDLGLRYQQVNHYTGLAPYLREQIRDDATRIITDYNSLHGTNYNLYKDGLKLTATIDATMQQYAERAVSDHMRSLQKSFDDHWKGSDPWGDNKNLLDNAIRQTHIYKSLKKSGLSESDIRKEMNKKRSMTIYSADIGEKRVEFSSIDSLKYYLKILHAGVIAIEPSTGKVKAWVGGLNFKYFQYDQVTASRQVGSIFKPIIYSTAINSGVPLNTYYPNVLKSYPAYKNWTPRNSDNKYFGYYTMRGALSKSINTIAVEILLQNGINNTIAHANKLGIESELPKVPSLALGVADISLKEMVRPYLCFANEGQKVTPYYIEEIKTTDGKVIYRAPTVAREQVISPNESRAITTMLSDAINEGTGSRLRSVYGLQIPLAGKTGTTQNQADGWFIGYNPQIVVGVRVGANDPQIHFRTITLGQGANTALPIFGLFMKSCIADKKFAQWNQAYFTPPTNEYAAGLYVPSYIDKLPQRIKKSQDHNIPTHTEKRKGIFKKIGDIFRKKGR